MATLERAPVEPNKLAMYEVRFHDGNTVPAFIRADNFLLYTNQDRVEFTLNGDIIAVFMLKNASFWKMHNLEEDDPEPEEFEE
jgi:hypothetical protein